jgi:MFS family permease
LSEPVAKLIDVITRFRAMLPARPEARRLLLGTLLAAVGHGMTLPFLFVYLDRVRHVEPTLVGVVVAWMGLLSLILSGPGGTLIDRFGVRRIVLPLYLVDAVGTASFGFARNALEAFGASTLCAVGGAVIWAAQNTLLSSVTTEQERQRVFGLSFAILNLGIGVGGTVAGFIVNLHSPGSFRTLYLVDGVATLVPALILIGLPGIGHRLASEEAAATAGGYREVLSNSAFRRFLIFGLLITVCGYAQFEVGYNAFSTLVSHVTPRVIAWAHAANTATIVLAQMTVIHWLAGRSRSRALAGVGLIIAASWTLLGVTGWNGHATSAIAVAGVIGCAVVFATGETIMSPMMPAITNAMATDELRGRFNAMSSMIWGVTAIAGPLTAAPLIGHGFGEIWVGVIVAGSLLAALVALSMRRLLTPAQDGRTIAAAAEPVPV